MRRLAPVDIGVGWAMAIVAVIVGVALAAPAIAPHHPYEQSLVDRLAPPAWLAGGDSARLFGTDDLGRDVLSRLLWGARVSLAVGLSATVIGMALGTVLGCLAGFRPGFVSELIMLLADAQLSLPFLVLAIGIVAVVGPSVLLLIVLAGISGWTTYARVTRGMVLTLREQEFVQSAWALGATPARVLTRHIAPSLVATVTVLASIQLASVILLEATLSFLGLGVQPPDASWGSMLGVGRDYLATAWWMSVFPGLALMLTVLSVCILGDWLRDVLDPTLAHERM